jgi:hypothetical protein
MELLEGASDWDGPRRKSRKPQKIFVEVFRSGGPLSIWRGVHVDLSRSLVKPFLKLIRGERPPLRCHGSRDGRLQTTKWKQAAKGGVLCRGEQRESRRNQ